LVQETSVALNSNYDIITVNDASAILISNEIHELKHFMIVNGLFLN